MGYKCIYLKFKDLNINTNNGIICFFLSLFKCQLLIGFRLYVKNFQEKLGNGFIAHIEDTKLKVGSATYLGIKRPKKNNETEVHIFIEEYLGYFAIKSHYRKGVFEMLKSLKQHYKMNFYLATTTLNTKHLISILTN